MYATGKFFGSKIFYTFRTAIGKGAKLSLTDACCLYTYIPYPANLVTPYGIEQVGTGEPISGLGWGTIDPNDSDPSWVSVFDNPTHQVEFHFVSPSIVNQSYYGDYASDLIVVPSTIKRVVKTSLGTANPNYLDATEDCDLILDIESKLLQPDYSLL